MNGNRRRTLDAEIKKGTGINKEEEMNEPVVGAFDMIFSTIV